jgi:uncharacterized damage-inducible protein DinB
MTATADARTTRPAPDEYAPYYGTYIGKVAEGDVVAALKGQITDTLAYLRAIPESRGGHRYAEGKWSIREVVGHLADAERIFAYRALRFARDDNTALPGFDENAFVANARFDERTLASLVNEYEAVRHATIAQFDAFFPEELLRAGTASGKQMSVRALAWVIAGHELHHLGILKERY